jgi:hypothetical protein
LFKGLDTSWLIRMLIGLCVGLLVCLALAVLPYYTAPRMRPVGPLWRYVLWGGWWNTETVRFRTPHVMAAALIVSVLVPVGVLLLSNNSIDDHRRNGKGKRPAERIKKLD